MKRFFKQLLSILTPNEQARLFVMAGLDLLMGVADVIFLVALLVIVRTYTGGVMPSSSSYSHLLSAANPVAVTGIFLVLFCVKNLLGVWVAKKQHHFIYGVSSRLSEKNIMNYLRGNYMDFVDVDSSRRIRQISQVPIEFGAYILTNFQQIIAQSILIVFTVVAILLYHPVLFVLLLLLLIPPVVLLGWFIKQQLKKVRIQIKTNSVKVIQYLQEALSGYVESNIYHNHHFFAGRYRQYQKQMNENIATQHTLQGVSSRFFEVFALLGFFILIAINKWNASKVSIDLLTIGVFMAAAYKIIPGMAKILNSAGQMKTYSFILDELGEKATILEKISPIAQQIISIRFNKISFKFNENSILDKVNFEIKAGDMTGISGVSGKGKTTMINLLLGFLTQHEGDIFINSKVVNVAERKAFWRQIAYVKQQGFFISDTILKNITLTDGEYDNDRLAQALKISGLDILLKDNPEGVHKLIKEHGKNISGGQRQRISLARALYHDFDLLILDEPFSEVDHDAEQEILKRIKNLAGDGKMVLLITHNRLSLSYCNKTISPYAA